MYNGYENSVQPYMYKKKNPNEYSSYDNYQPADYDNACASSYNDGYAKTITMWITDTVNIQQVLLIPSLRQFVTLSQAEQKVTV